MPNVRSGKGPNGLRFGLSDLDGTRDHNGMYVLVRSGRDLMGERRGYDCNPLDR